DDHRVGRVRVEGERRAVDREGGVRHPARPRLDDGLGHARPTRLLEDEHAVELVELEQTHADAPLPQAGYATGFVLPRGAPGMRWTLLLEQVARRVAEGQLVVGEGEPHRGSPSTRSATTLRR